MNEHRPSVLVVDDKPNMLRLMAKVLSDIAVVHTATNGTDALAALDTETVDVVLCDLKMPGIDGLEVFKGTLSRQPRARFILMTAHATVETAVSALKDGAFDYLTKPFDPSEAKSAVMRALHCVGARDGVAETAELLPGVHGRSRAMVELATVVRQIATTNLNILIIGESGTGKERLARAIHRLSRRAEQPFHILDCRAQPLPAAPTAQAAVHACFSVADVVNRTMSGTLFIRGIGAMGARDQALLQHHLEQSRTANAGEAGFRVIASTSRDLDRLASEGAFRRDLILQIRVALLRVTPLRERREDIPLLASHALAELHAGTGDRIGFSAGALEHLGSIGWPGNIRELRSVVEHAFAMAGDGPITLDCLPDWLQSEAEEGPAWEQLTWSDALARGRADAARRYLVSLLKRFDGDVVKAAGQAAVERESFYRLLRKHGIQPEGFRKPQDG